MTAQLYVTDLYKETEETGKWVRKCSLIVTWICVHTEKQVKYNVGAWPSICSPSLIFRAPQDWDWSLTETGTNYSKVQVVTVFQMFVSTCTQKVSISTFAGHPSSPNWVQLCYILLSPCNIIQLFLVTNVIWILESFRPEMISYLLVQVQTNSTLKGTMKYP